MADGADVRKLPSAARVPPHALEAEMSVLGGLMLDERKFDDVADMLSEPDFYREQHRLVWRAIRALASTGRRHDWVTVSEWLRDDVEADRRTNPQGLDSLERVGGQGAVAQLTLDVPGASNVRAYAEIVRKRALQREVIASGLQLIELGMEPEDRSTPVLIDEAQRVTANLGSQASQGEPVLMGGLISGFCQRQAERAERRQGGQSFGLRGLDAKTGGMEPGDFIVIAGRPSMGKTALGLSIANTVAAFGGAVLGFSMEMPSEQWLARLAANRGGIPMGRIKSPWLMDDLDSAGLHRALGEIGAMPFLVDETPALTITQLRAKARRAHRRQPLSLVLIDYLQLMAGEGKRRDENRTQELDAVSRSLKALAKELAVPVIALAQLNRGLEARDNKRPRMSDIREAGGIEQDADIVIGLYRDEVYNPESVDAGICEALILKQRNGETGKVELSYQGEFFRFADWVGASYSDRHPARESSRRRGFQRGPEAAPSPDPYEDLPPASTHWSDR